MAKGDDIETRLIDFAVAIISLTDKLPTSRAGNHLAGHYAEARGAESSRDFVHKLKICLKELNESRVWLKIIWKGKLLSNDVLKDVYQECDELCRIINASVKTAKTKSYPK